MKKNEKELAKFEKAWQLINNHYLLGSIAKQTNLIHNESVLSINGWNKNSIAFIKVISNNQAHVFININKKYTEQQFLFVYAVIMLIMGFQLYEKIHNSKEKELAIVLFAINYVVNVLQIEDVPSDFHDFFKAEELISFKNEESTFEQILNLNLYEKFKHLNFLKSEEYSIVFKPSEHVDKINGYQKSFSQIFADNIVKQAQRTITLSSQKNYTEEQLEDQKTLSYKAKKWFVNHFPLLSALAAQFKIIEDIKICKVLDISIAAVSVEHKEIYVNPLAHLSENGMKFVIAHEILHVALNHASRRQGRNRLLWNLACDFVINSWLIEMNIGIPPEGIYFDKELSGKSADEIYLLIVKEERLRKNLGTLRNKFAGEITKKTQQGCDMLDDDIRYFSEFEDACKSALLRGVFLHEVIGRGDLPADLVAEIKALNQPPIPWQVQLAKWISEKFPLEESKRTYAKPSRRQSSTPDIPRPRYVRPEDIKNTKTFGVVMDTSASMDKKLLAKCLGAIASYSSAQEVKMVRIVYCDAQPYDAGYINVETLSNKIQVRGGGGTVLQPAIDLLERAKDFPDNAPILILTDGFFESNLKVSRDHAYLVPRKVFLPFIPKVPVFEFK